MKKNPEKITLEKGKKKKKKIFMYIHRVYTR